MMVIYEEELPESYLLILAPGKEDPTTALKPCLNRACYSGKPVVLVDCRLLSTVSSQDAAVLLEFEKVLHQHHVQLVLCQVPEVLSSELHRQGARPHMVPSLQDVAWHGRS